MEIIVILVLILLNGLFALAEIAVIAARPAACGLSRVYPQGGSPRGGVHHRVYAVGDPRLQGLSRSMSQGKPHEGADDGGQGRQGGPPTQRTEGGFLNGPGHAPHEAQ